MERLGFRLTDAQARGDACRVRAACADDAACCARTAIFGVEPARPLHRGPTDRERPVADRFLRSRRPHGPSRPSGISPRRADGCLSRPHRARRSAVECFHDRDRESAREPRPARPTAPSRPAIGADRCTAFRLASRTLFETKGIATTANSHQLIDHVPAGILRSPRGWRHAALSWSASSPVMNSPSVRRRGSCRDRRLAIPGTGTLSPGGSSSGTAAAVAAGMVLGGIGSDTSGSVRSPAALCGIAGLKPTYDVIDRRGVIPLAPSLDHGGPMCWTVEDCAILFHALVRRDGHDRHRLAGRHDRARQQHQRNCASAWSVTSSPKTWRSAPRACAQSTPRWMCSAMLGCVVRDVRLPPLADWMASGFLILLAEAFALHEHWLKTRPERYGARSATRCCSARPFPAPTISRLCAGRPSSLPP